VNRHLFAPEHRPPWFVIVGGALAMRCAGSRRPADGDHTLLKRTSHERARPPAGGVSLKETPRSRTSKPERGVGSRGPVCGGRHGREPLSGWTQKKTPRILQKDHEVWVAAPSQYTTGLAFGIHPRSRRLSRPVASGCDRTHQACAVVEVFASAHRYPRPVQLDGVTTRSGAAAFPALGDRALWIFRRSATRRSVLRWLPRATELIMGMTSLCGTLLALNEEATGVDMEVTLRELAIRYVGD
jgi:hypothetical protein